MIKKSSQILPPQYEQCGVINIQQDPKKARMIAVANIWIFAVLLSVGFLIVPLRAALGSLDSVYSVALFMLRFVVTIVAWMLYIPLHEFTHAMTMKCLGAVNIQFHVSWNYACMGSKYSFFTRDTYRLIALMPLAFWSPIFLLIAAGSPREWFWPVWIVFANHLSGSIVDIFVVWYVSKWDRDTLIQDTGFDVAVYRKKDRTNSFSQSNC